MNMNYMHVKYHVNFDVLPLSSPKLNHSHQKASVQILICSYFFNKVTPTRAFVNSKGVCFGKEEHMKENKLYHTTYM